MSEELRTYAEELILEHARDVEPLTIFEMAETRLDRDISEDEMRQVNDLIGIATITITWPEED